MNDKEGQESPSVVEQNNISVADNQTSINSKAPETSPGDKRPPKPKRERKKNNKLLYIIAALVALILLIVILVILLNKKPEESTPTKPDSDTGYTLPDDANQATILFDQWYSDTMEFIETYNQNNRSVDAVWEHIQNNILKINDDGIRNYKLFLALRFLMGKSEQYISDIIAMIDESKLDDYQRYELWTRLEAYYETRDPALSEEYRRKWQSLPAEVINEFIIGG